jgi:hypothetical protein
VRRLRDDSLLVRERRRIIEPAAARRRVRDHRAPMACLPVIPLRAAADCAHDGVAGEGRRGLVGLGTVG